MYHLIKSIECPKNLNLKKTEKYAFELVLDSKVFCC